MGAQAPTNIRIMQIAIVGLGRMGQGVARRLLRAGHTVHAYNRTYAKTDALASDGAVPYASLRELVQGMPGPRSIWMYLPSGDVTVEHMDELLELLEQGDTLIDGGNSHFKTSAVYAAKAQSKGIGWLDVGTSGGIGGETVGYCLMIGGEPAVVEAHHPLLESVAGEQAWTRVGPPSSGHYVKMVHNAIEYGMLEAYAEGMAVLEDGSFSGQLDLPAVTSVWQQGSIITSRIGGWVDETYHSETLLPQARTEVEENGESRWTVQEAIDQRISVPVLADSLFVRFASQGRHPIAAKVTNAVRSLFGGHKL